MLTHQAEPTVISHPFPQVCQAHTLRYPNPFSPHVISSDILERRWDHDQKTFHTTRLLLKRGTLPGWAPRGIIEKSETWVLEQSDLHLDLGEYHVSSRNLDHRKVMEVVEQIQFRARGEVCDATTSVQVTSSWGFHLIRKRIEHYGISRFQRQTKSARLGLEMTIQILQPQSTLRDRLLDGEKLNYPPVVPSSAVAARLHALRARAKENKNRISALLRRGGLESTLSHDQSNSEEPMTQEEEAELQELENEYGLVSSDGTEELKAEDHRVSGTFDSLGSSSLTSPHQPKRRWFWWWRWHLGTACLLEPKPANLPPVPSVPSSAGR